MSFALLQLFHVDLGSPHTISNWTLYLNKGEDWSNSVNHDRIQVLSYSKYSLLVLPIVGIEYEASRRFHAETPSKQTPYPLAQLAGAVVYTDCTSAEG